MVLVTVTGYAWGHDRQPISSTLQPELWFRPLSTSLSNGLMSSREVKATLTTSSGAFTVQLESQPGMFYIPVLRWLAAPDNSNESMQNRARVYDEWKPIFPGPGGPIDELPDAVQLRGFYYGFGDPPDFLRPRNDVIYVDISGSGDGYWQPWVPQGAYVEEGS